MDTLDLSVREFLTRLFSAHTQPRQSDWTNIRTAGLPWRHILDAAKRGECTVSPVGRKLFMRRADLDRWLESQALSRQPDRQTAKTSTNDEAVARMLAKSGYG